jgi:hypothetical protein
MSHPIPSSRPAYARVALAAAFISLVLIGCGGERGDASRAGAAPATAPARPAAPAIALKDVLETTPTHIIGISYPKELAKYPGLASQAQRYAEQARAQVVDAVRQRPNDPAAGPFELSLEFKLKHESPEVVVLAVDGSSYTGGAHGTPMIQRWVWLPPQNRLLTAAELFPQDGSWRTISTSVREQLRNSVAQRLEADRVPAAERAAVVRTAGAMIDGGTEARPEDFAVFEPVMTPDGKIGALRFVFPPYQVGTYADGMHTVELPAAQLVGLVNPDYRRLFEAA